MTHPKAHPIAGAVATREHASFEAELGRPLLIVGNGPSSAMPDSESLPANPVVFRMNWFFLEDRYYYGRKVDALLFSIANEALERSLATAMLEGWYDIDRVFTPIKLPLGRDGEPHRSELYMMSAENLDHWALISEVPTLARFMMSRPLPTQGVQALAAGLALGFREVHLCGIDMYESTDRRYSYQVPDSVATALERKDLTPGYEDRHSLDRDLDFVDACIKQFPQATIYYRGPSRHLQARFDAPPQRHGEASFAGRSPASWLDEPKPVLERVGSAETDYVLAESPGAPYAMVNGQRCGFVTLVSGPFHHGARALAKSLARISDIPLTVMCTPSADRARLRASGLFCLDVPEIVNPNRLRGSNARFEATYSKLHAFRLPHLDRAVYVDADMIVLQNIDDLFERDGFWAAPDHGLDFQYDRFNSGLFKFDVSLTMFDEMVRSASSIKSYDGGDQGFLNEFFSGWNALPQQYNVNKRWAVRHPNLFRLDETKVLHYVGIKPWQHEDPTAYDDLNRLWFTFLDESELIEVAESLRWSAPKRKSAPGKNSAPQGETGPGDGFASSLRAVFRRVAKRRMEGDDWFDGTLLRRLQARNRDGAYADALELIESEFRTGQDGSPGLLWERAKTYLLNGDAITAERLCAEAAQMYPQHRTLVSNYPRVRQIARAQKMSSGILPRRLVAACVSVAYKLRT